MSLRLWAPLNGDLRQQGASGANIINNSATVNTAGKIGSCYAFNGSSQYLYSEYNFYSPQYSTCAWVYSTSSSATQTVICNRTTTGSGFSIFLIGGKLRIDPGGQNVQWTTSYTYPINTWFHLGITYDGAKVSYYINGEYKESHTCTLSSGYWKDLTSFGASYGTQGAYGNYLNGRLNDIRIYDHCLSAAEVHEIAQGLVLHYKLNQPIGLTDAILNQDTYTVYNNYASSGTTGTLTNLSETFNGHVVRREVMTPNDTSVGNFKVSLGSHGVYGHRQTFLANTKYVFWIYYRPISHTDIRAGGVASNIGGWTEIPPIAVGNGWYRVGQYRNGTVATDKTDSIFTSFYTPTAASGVPITIDWAAPHLLIGTTEIPDDDSFMGNDYIEDSSGYGHHGEIVNALFTSNDTPRYNACTHISATNQKIKISNFPTSGFGNSYSFSWWAKISSVSPMHWGFADGIRLNGMYTGRLWNTGDSSNNPLYTPGTTTQVATPTVNVWHHWVMTGDGTTCKVYQDGVYWGIAKTYKAISGQTIYINGWDSGTSYCSDNYSISDFRIYATALSADDVLTLYHTGAKVDNKKNIHSYSFNEINSAKILKTGVMNGSIAENLFTQHLKYDQNVYIEPDGSVWVRAFHHNNPTSNKFASSDTFTTSVYKNADTWFNMEVCNYLNKWEIMVKSRATPDAVEYKYRWIQQYNPMTATYANVAAANVTKVTTDGYTNYSWGGLYHIGSSTYLSTNNGTNGNWWGAVGAWSAHQGGIPGWTVVITTGYEDVYLRIDNVNWNAPDNAKITKNNIWIGDNFIEL